SERKYILHPSLHCLVHANQGNPSDVVNASTKVTSEFVDESLKGPVSEYDVVSNVGTSLAPKTDVVLSFVTSVVPDIVLDQNVPDTY
ncbi:hypothetical protein L195_g061429, partial [Trifolium pratense]